MEIASSPPISIRSDLYSNSHSNYSNNSPEFWSGPTSLSSYTGPYPYIDSVSTVTAETEQTEELASNRSKRSLKDKLATLLRYSAKVYQTNKENLKNFRWINYNETDERLPFSGKVYNVKARKKSPSVASSGYESDEISTPVILSLDREPRNFRNSVIIEESPKIDDTPPAKPTPENLLETCFLDYTKEPPIQIFDNLPRIPESERRKSSSSPERIPRTPPGWFRVSQFDRPSPIHPRLRPVSAYEPLERPITPVIQPMPPPPSSLTNSSLSINTCSRTSSLSRIPILKSSTLPSKLLTSSPLQPLVRQRTFDSGVSTISIPSVSANRRRQLRRSLSPTYSLSSEPPRSRFRVPVPKSRGPSSLTRSGSLGKNSEIRRPVSPSSSVSSREHRHANCFRHAPTPVVRSRSLRVPPTSLRIENEPRRPRPQPLIPRNPMPRFDPLPEIKIVEEHEVPVRTPTTRPRSPASRIRNIILDERYRSDLQIGRSQSFDSGSRSSVYVLDLSRTDLRRDELLILLTSDDPILLPMPKAEKETLC